MGMVLSIAFLGRGGQGIVFAGTVLSEIMFEMGYYVSQLQSYGAEVRGGTVIAYVVIGREPIENPFIESFDIAVVLHEDPLRRWSSHIKGSRIVIVDGDLVRTRYENMVEAPLSRRAVENNVYQSLNMVALGLVLGLGIIDADRDIVDKVLRKKKNYEVNKRSVEIGYEIAQSIKDTIKEKLYMEKKGQ